jgi:NADPH2:quinone reductase
LLRVEERPDPVPGPGQVLVAVEAAGVNFVDALFVAGQYQIKPPLPFTPGSELAGRVAALGEGVTDGAVGDRVLVTTGLGGYVSHVVAPASATVPLPDRLDAAQGATFTQSYSTALFGLRDRASVRAGESVLVLGAGGGIGLAAITVARALGCRVLGVASSPEKREAARRAGAEEVLDGGHDPLKERARQWAGGTGVDVVVDPVGGAASETALRALGDGGRYLVIGFASGTIPSVPLNQVLLRNRTVLGIDWGMWSIRHADLQRALLGDLLAMVEAGTVTPEAPATYPLEAVSDVLEALLARRIVGKVALVP